ncbi:MAG: phospholipase D-like domain-containing protein [Acidimicrobiales bacterium]
MTGAPVHPGNRVEIMRNGATLEAMLDAIRSATHTIDLSSYIYWPGSVAEEFCDALTERARSGVEVNVMLDGYGSAKLDRRHVQRLREAGIHLSIFRPVRWHTLKKLNNRMHRRILIVDGALGFAGGVGIADVWTGDAQDPDHWRETHLRVEGPAVLDLVGAFAETWTEATGDLLAGIRTAEIPALQGGVDAQVTRSTPTAGQTAATALFYSTIAGARSRLWVTTAYFAPDRAFEDALCASAKRGVDVRILVNGRHVDKEVARQAGRRSYASLLTAGARIFEYDQTMLHAKVLLADDNWANVGSGNFDSRSLDLDLEVNVAVTDADLISELERHFLEDVGVSREIDLASWNNRRWRQKAAEYATELVRQSL